MYFDPKHMFGAYLFSLIFLVFWTLKGNDKIGPYYENRPRTYTVQYTH